MIKIANNLQQLKQASPMIEYIHPAILSSLAGLTGTLGGAGIGALIQALRGKSIAKGLLIGGGVGGAAGIGGGLIGANMINANGKSWRESLPPNAGRRVFVDGIEQPEGTEGMTWEKWQELHSHKK